MKGIDKKTKRAILFDVENLFFASMEDTALSPYRQSKILEAIAFAIEQVAVTYGESAIRCAAFSYPSLREDSRIEKAQVVRMQKQAENVVSLLRDIGFDIVLMTKSVSNAADHALFDYAKLVSLRDDVSTVIIATGDGHAPFPALVDHVVAAGKKVVVVAYDLVGAAFRSRNDIETALIAGSVRRMLEGQVLRGPDEKRLGNKTAKPIVVSSAPKPDAVALIRSSIKEFGSGRKPETAPPESTAEHIPMMRRAVEILEGAPGERRERTFEKLFKMLENEQSWWPIPIPSHKELVELLSGLIKYTDIFQQKPAYSINEASKDLRRIKEVGFIEFPDKDTIEAPQ